MLVFRDCFMNTLEAAYELKAVGEFMIASQSEMPIAGIWPWLPLMTTLLPGARPRDVARSLAMQIGRFLDVQANRGPQRHAFPLIGGRVNCILAARSPDMGCSPGGRPSAPATGASAGSGR